MKVSLISPPNKFLIDPSMSEPLGLMYIEEVLLQNGYDVAFVDLSFDREIPKADVYCFTATTINIPDVLEIADELKGIKIIGGPHATALPEEMLKDFNMVICGPGEKSILKAISSMENGIFRDFVNIDEVPIPRRTIWHRLNYRVVDGNNKAATIMTARGCPNKCSFCASNVIWGRKVQFRSVESVIEEIVYLKKKYDIHDFKFIDDVFTLNKKRFLNVVKELNKLNIRWTCNTRIDSIDGEVVEGLKAGGATCVDLGIESVEDSVLSKIHKNQTSEQCRKAIDLIHKHNLKTKIYLIHGLPYESKNIVKNTISFIKDTKPDKISLFTLTPYPGTDVFINPDKYNITWIKDNFKEYRHAVGKSGEIDEPLPNIEYKDRSIDLIHKQRRELVNFCNKWNAS